MGASSTAGLGQALDFRDECDALHAVLENAPAEAWAEPTQFKGWTFDDVLGHLYFFRSMPPRSPRAVATRSRRCSATYSRRAPPASR